ncbi:MAG: DUF3365 domain-containing protein [Desulfomonilaceae bacterium]|jgi:nitrogen-specific signal transduction histidine kinase/HAMP domain-containing protein
MQEQPVTESTASHALSLQTKFSLGIIAILGLFTCLLSYGLYRQLENSLISNVYEKSEIILAELEATRKYVAEILRPKVSTLVASDEFILEAMSTAYVSRQIMERFQTTFPDFGYKRAAINPRELRNQADAFEKDVLLRFEQDPRLKEWHGIVRRDNERFFVRMSPIYTETSCLRCHGTPDEAPAKLIGLYGPEFGFGRKQGDISGMDVLSFPVESAMGQIRRRALGVLGPGLLAIVAAMIMVIALFKTLVVNRIGFVKEFFSEFVSDGGDLSRRIETKQNDEIGRLCSSFNVMADKLNNIMKERDTLLVESYEQREKMRSIIDGITDKLMLIKPDRSVLMANKASISEIHGNQQDLKCYQLIHELDTPCSGCLLEKTIDEKTPTFGEVCHGNKEIYLAHFYPIRNRQTGQVESVVHYCKSITEKKRMEQHMMQAEKLASLGQMVAGVAHELNNPLGLILFYSELLKKELPGESGHLMDIEVIEKHTETCRTVVRDLLHFSRNVETIPVPGLLNDSIEQVILVLEKQFSKDGIRVERNFDCSLPPICFDDNRLKQVWMNLILNARHAIKHSDGVITVSTSCNKKSGLVSVTIRDNGEGMAPEIINKIFDPFFTTKKTGEGTGLGLSVSYGIVKDHGGEITVWSELTKGSTFTVTLPEKVREQAHG